MQSTNHFKQTVLNYLENRAATDTLFAAAFGKEHKNIDGCITYILNTVEESGCNGFSDDEIYSMAVHYYDEDSIEAGNPVNCRIIVNHSVELTAEEKEQARQEAIKRAQDEVYSKIKQPLRKPQTKQSAVTGQLNLFAV